MASCFQRTAAVLLIITLRFPAMAQTTLGVEAGVTNNSPATNIANTASTALATGWGYAIGLTLQQKINAWLSLVALPDLTGKNYALNGTDVRTGVYEKIHNTYLQLPLMVQFSYGRKIQPFINAGPYIGYWLSGRVKGAMPDIFSATNTGALQSFQLIEYNTQYNFDSRRDARWEFGWQAGGGIQYCLNHRYTLFLACRYYQALTDQQKKYMIHQVPFYNRAWTVLFGALMTLKKKRKDAN